MYIYTHKHITFNKFHFLVIKLQKLYLDDHIIFFFNI